MSDRRKNSISRMLLKLLPEKLRFPLMRSQLKISPNLDVAFEFKIARSQQDLAEAYRILHDSYLELGYSTKQISGMRIVKNFALPSTTTLVATYNKKVIGTISIIRRGTFNLPMESVFDLSDFTSRNEVIAEVSSLAIDSCFRQKRGQLFLPLLKFFWEYVDGFMNLDSIVISVNPSMVDFYIGFLGFSRLKEAKVSNYTFANGNPAVGLYLNVRTAPAIFQCFYGHKPIEKNLYHYFTQLKLAQFELPHRNYYKSSDPVMTPEMLNYFFVQNSNVFSELSPQEKMGLASAYPNEQYQNMFQQSPNNCDRDRTRYLVHIKGHLCSDKTSDLSIFDASLNGICLKSNVFLSHSVSLKIAVAKNQFAVVNGEVRWKDPIKNIYGIEIVKTDLVWLDFIKYLNQDFDILVDILTKQAS